MKCTKYFELEMAKKREVPLTVYEENTAERDTQELEDKKLYQSIVGVLNYICNAVRYDNWLARRVNHATNYDLKIAKRTLTYLRDNKIISLKIKALDLKEDIYITAYVVLVLLIQNQGNQFVVTSFMLMILLFITNVENKH